MLSNCHDPFPAASDATKQEFEKRTAPINFTAADQPTADGVGKAAGTLPAIAELKRSALEFSKAIDIDEVAALRIVVLEYQMGPAKALLAAEAGAGSDPDIGPGNFGVSFLESVFKPNQVDDQKQKDEQVFYNRLEVYLSERRYLLKVATSLIRAVICRASKNNVWHEIGQQFLAQGVVEWPGFASKLIDGIELRWKEVKPGGNGLPKWVETRMDELAGDQILYTWEKQVLYNCQTTPPFFFEFNC
jgi:nuclear pore complex protein Nup188